MKPWWKIRFAPGKVDEKRYGADLPGVVAYREHEVVVAGGVAVNVVGGMSGDVDANSAITRIASG